MESIYRRSKFWVPLVKNEIIGSSVVKLVMSGGYCLWGKQGIALAKEAFSKLQLLPFTKSRNASIFDGFFKNVSQLLSIYQKFSTTCTSKTKQERMQNFYGRRRKCKSFGYWNKSADEFILSSTILVRLIETSRKNNTVLFCFWQNQLSKLASNLFRRLSQLT